MSSSPNLSNTLVHLVCQNQSASVPRSCAAEHIRTFKISIGRNSVGSCLVIGVERQLKMLSRRLFSYTYWGKLIALYEKKFEDTKLIVEREKKRSLEWNVMSQIRVVENITGIDVARYEIQRRGQFVLLNILRLLSGSGKGSLLWLSCDKQ